jgi:hypothetical protein
MRNLRQGKEISVSDVNTYLKDLALLLNYILPENVSTLSMRNFRYRSPEDGAGPRIQNIDQLLNTSSNQWLGPYKVTASNDHLPKINYMTEIEKDITAIKDL